MPEAGEQPTECSHGDGKVLADLGEHGRWNLGLHVAGGARHEGVSRCGARPGNRRLTPLLLGSWRYGASAKYWNLPCRMIRTAT
jgi:hypothetical protein